jgi:hypothetical protein
MVDSFDPDASHVIKMNSSKNRFFRSLNDMLENGIGKTQGDVFKYSTSVRGFVIDHKIQFRNQKAYVQIGFLYGADITFMKCFMRVRRLIV